MLGVGCIHSDEFFWTILTFRASTVDAQNLFQSAILKLSKTR